MTAPSEPVFIRFLGKEPNVAQIPDDPEALTQLVRTLAELLEPRERDKGWLSLWKTNTRQERAHVLAAFAARRGERNKLVFIPIPERVFSAAGVQLRNEPDTETFACVSGLHYVADLASLEFREQLASVLKVEVVDRLRPGDDLCDRVSRKDILRFLGEVYDNCRRSGSTPPLDECGDWVRSQLPPS